MRYTRLLLVALILQLLATNRGLCEFIDFNSWTLIEDPADPNFSASVNTSAATLAAGNGVVSAGTDIGFQSVNGSTAAASTLGFQFAPSSDFTIALDYQWTFAGNPTGLLGLGFGIGEDGNGRNSAGVAMLTFDGSPALFFAGAGRVNDQSQSLSMSPLTPSALSGSLFVAYDALTGNVIVGASAVPGASTPTTTGIFSGIQKQWSGDDLLASFFIRSDGTGWQGGGTATAVFSNLRVLQGSPVAVPEPTACLPVALFSIFAATVSRRCKLQRKPAG